MGSSTSSKLTEIYLQFVEELTIRHRLESEEIYYKLI